MATSLFPYELPDMSAGNGYAAQNLAILGMPGYARGTYFFASANPRRP
jgi:hypothetical protein